MVGWDIAVYLAPQGQTLKAAVGREHNYQNRLVSTALHVFDLEWLNALLESGKLNVLKRGNYPSYYCCNYAVLKPWISALLAEETTFIMEGKAFSLENSRCYGKLRNTEIKQHALAALDDQQQVYLSVWDQS